MTRPTTRVWSAPFAADAIRAELLRGDEEMALRMLTEAAGAFDLIESEGQAAEFLRAPELIGDARFDTLLATVLRWKALERGFAAPDWTFAPALPVEWMPGTSGTPLAGWRDHVRSNTPPILLEKGILALRKSWSVA